MTFDNLYNPMYNKLLKHVGTRDTERRLVDFFCATTNGPVLPDSSNLPSREEVPNQLVAEAHRFVQERVKPKLEAYPNSAQLRYIFLDVHAKKVANDLGIPPEMQLRFFVKAVLIVAEAVDFNIAVRYTLNQYGRDIKFNLIAHNKEVTFSGRTYVADVQSTDVLDENKALLVRTSRGGKTKIVLVPALVAAEMHVAAQKFNGLSTRMRQRWCARELYYQSKRRGQQ